ncbi:hypothetical protein FACS1894170_01540 [Planctomycetales bacterium]|nr:hypothetical protein FACS1894170_01540 [Planctomycetales bacterium]
MKRRNFIKLTTLGAATLALNTPVTHAESIAEPLWIQLTKDVKTTRIGFGTGMRGSQRQSDLTRAGWQKGIEMLRYAYDRGIRLFDAADLYGTHFVIAEALKDKPRDSYTVVTKVWFHNGNLPELERLDPKITVKRFLRELKTDYIDVVQLHCVLAADWVEKFADAMESMEALKKEGVIRAHGISSHSNAATDIAIKTPWCDVIHHRINSEGMNMDGSTEAAERVAEGVRLAKAAHDAGKGVIAMKVLGEGKMAHDPALRKKSTQFVAGLESIDVMIVGFTEKEHITEFLANAPK